MRLLAVQENGYGVGLAEHQFPGGADSAIMATTDNMDAKNDAVVEEGSVISNLPLLFANGYPTSLEKITLVQLERFVSFMVQCSLGQDTTELITEPQWWPKEVKFSNPLTRPKRVNENWMANLKKLVFRCYTYHRSEYLLRFCSYLARYPHEELEYVNNWDSTTSLYHKSTGKLLVTFRNENMNYDKRNESPRKKLLSRNGTSSSSKSRQLHSLIMVEPPSDDIYLCDNCDAELVGYEKMKEHERVCCEQEQTSGSSRPTTPESSIVVPELRQDQFLEYFCLRSEKAPARSSTTDEGNPNSNNSYGNGLRRSRRVRGAINFTRCQTIPFSSPAGIVLAKKSKMMTEEILQERLERIERHAIAPVLDVANKPKWMTGEADRDKWIVTHKQSRDRPVDDYVHEYKFVNSVKRKPMNNNELARRKKTRVNGQGAPSKRKAPGDKDERTPTTNAEGSVVDTQSNTVKQSTVATPELPANPPVNPINRTVPAFDRMETASPKPLPAPPASNEITVISLCSSDEEDEQRPRSNVVPDENTEPETNANSLLRKLCAKPCIYPAEQNTGNWLSANILTDDAENCGNKYRTAVMMNTCAHLSPILRPAAP